MTFRFGAATTLSLTALTLLFACGGQVVSIGGESTAQSLTPSAVTVATDSCPTGYQHANICCTGGSKTSSPTCEAWPNDPFHPCDSGYTMYPNAASCCALDNPADCLTCTGTDATPPSTGTNGSKGSGGTPVDTGTSTGGSNACASDNPPPLIDGGIGGGNTTCENRCPPGYTGISPYDSAGCCQYDSNGVGTCFGEAAATVDDASVPPILLADGGEYDGGVGDLDGGPFVDAGVVDGGSPQGGGSGGSGGGSTGGSGGSGGATTCAFACPDGWFVADPTQGVCCSNSKDGAEECFAAVFPNDNGGSGGVDPTGNNGSTNGVGTIEPTDAGVPAH